MIHSTFFGRIRWEINFIRHNFEPQGWQDYALIPWWILRFLFACFWYWAARLTIGRRLYWDGIFMGWGGDVDPTPVICPRCLWAGPRRWMIHTYHACGDDDVEPVDECPRCGQDG